MTDTQEPQKPPQPRPWPPSTRPYRTSPPAGAAGVVLPVRDDIKFFKLTFHSLVTFSDYRFMLTLIDNMCGIETVDHLNSLRKNHNVNVIQYQNDHNLAAEWNAGLKLCFAWPNVKYGVVMTPTVVVEPYWLSRIVRTLSDPGVGIVSPRSNDRDAAMLTSCFGFRKEVYEAAGGFNEGLAREDDALDFAQRVRNLGLSVAQDPLAYVHKFTQNDFDYDAFQRRAAAPKEAQEAGA